LLSRTGQGRGTQLVYHKSRGPRPETAALFFQHGQPRVGWRDLQPTAHTQTLEARSASAGIWTLSPKRKRRDFVIRALALPAPIPALGLRVTILAHGPDRGGSSTAASTGSPPLGVASAFITAGLTFSLTNRTEPSAIAKWAPPWNRGPPKPCGDLLTPFAGSR